MSMDQTARLFFDACETGKGWDACASYCTPDATFAAQAEPLGDVTTLAGYAEWMKGLLGLMPDARYDLKAWGTDGERNCVVAFAVFHGTHTGEGGPVPPTGKSCAADYVYAMYFEGDKIARMTKIWNSGFTLKQVGWA